MDAVQKLLGLYEPTERQIELFWYAMNLMSDKGLSDVPMDRFDPFYQEVLVAIGDDTSLNELWFAIVKCSCWVQEQVED